MRSTCRHFPDCPFSVVVRELPGALRPRNVTGRPFSFLSLFVSFVCVCVFVCDPRIFYLQRDTTGKNVKRKQGKKKNGCVWLCKWLTKVVTVEQFNWFIISRADYSPIAFNPTSWIVVILLTFSTTPLLIYPTVSTSTW
jgi:hypothetical protein